MTFHLDTNQITLQPETHGLRLTTDAGSNLLLANVTIAETQEVVTRNYHTVKNHYAEKGSGQIETNDLERLSLRVVLNYFYMYQLWRGIYENEKNRDLTFIVKDFEHPSTSDIIVAYFKSANKANYADKCGLLMGMSLEEFREHEKNRQAFFDRR